ncbi:unnamed protein product [Caenorhabditis bovis]|uniref:ABC1 atypical kinase-like domain-containing protein n=1 Tax=Caenorhabditis bovis TaxID=2654633 RepID=A0A8S1EWX2_9PELO|nr:unnamed protein product [Caenorhabditis bovis]
MLGSSRFLLRRISLSARLLATDSKKKTIEDITQEMLQAPVSRVPPTVQRFVSAFRQKFRSDGLDPSVKSILDRASAQLYYNCADNFDFPKLCEAFGLGDYMSSWYKLTLMHTWMVLMRLHGEFDGKAYVRLQHGLLSTMWLDIDNSKELGQVVTSESDMKHMHGVHLQTFFEYDEGFLSDDRVLAGAVWRCLYMSRPVDPIHLLRVVTYIRSTVAWLETCFLMAKPPFPSSTLKWCQQEFWPICEGFSMVARSQIGYDARRAEVRLRRKALEVAVCGGKEVDPLETPNTKNDPLFPTSNEALQRARVVAAGIEAFAKLLSSGVYPGAGGYTLSENGEKLYVKQSLPLQTSVISNLMKTAEKVGQGVMKVAPFPLPVLTQLGTWVLTNPKAELPLPAQFKTIPQIAQLEQLIQSVLGVSSSNSTNNIEPTKLKLRGLTKKFRIDEIPLDSSLSKEEADFLLRAAQSVEDDDAVSKIYGKSRETTLEAVEAQKVAENQSSGPIVYRPELPKDYELNLNAGNTHSLTRSNESKVPSTRIGRLATFGSLAFGLLGGAAAEVTRRTVGMGQKAVTSPKNPFLSEANADRIVATLCRVRGAALKLGQMLSIQDSSTVPPALLQVFERVRQSADFMPLKQVHKQMREAFGDDWRDKFAEFDEKPFACASIGQVHKGKLHDGREVAIKIQYPGVAEGIDSDIDNLVSVLSVGGIFPKGMYLDSFVKVARRELKQECDYEREARAMRKFRELIGDWKDVYIPEVIDELSSSRVLTTQLVYGKPVDACLEEPQIVRDYIAGKFIELCLKEIFVWRFMQTDPNWSNFFLGKHPSTGEPCIILLDFGASRSYGKKFVDIYMNIIKAAYDGDTKKIIDYSREIGFLTGYETSIMEQAHVESVMIMGETLASNHPYDFSKQDVTTRIQKLIPVMLEHRLTSPPEEIYSLHRKLSGCYLLAAKLKATVSCGGLFHEINTNYQFGDDGNDIDIDTVEKSA